MFLKKDFKNGMIVELDTGERRLFWNDKFIDKYGYIPLGHYDDNLNNIDNISKNENIDKVFLAYDVRYFDDFFSDKSLTEIWNRFK